MDLLKNIIIICFVSLIGIFIGTYIYNASKIKTEVAFKETNKVYLLQYGVYSSKESMKDASSNLSDYFYYYDKDGYHVIIGIVINKKNTDKIRESYGIKDNIYLKEVNISNMEFIECLKQYDNLVKSLKENKEIINAEKSILSKYEELILNNE